MFEIKQFLKFQTCQMFGIFEMMTEVSLTHPPTHSFKSGGAIRLVSDSCLRGLDDNS